MPKSKKGMAKNPREFDFSQTDEKALIYGLKQGSEQAFSMLVKSYRGRVINTCFGFVRHKQDAEDVAQDVFIEVFRNISKFNEKVALWVWLYRLSMQKSIDFVRMKTRKKRYAKILSLFYDDGSPIQFPDEIPPSDGIEQKELSEILSIVISRLSPRQQKAFILSRNEGLSNAETGKILNISESAVESLITRANRRLKELLYKYYKQ